MNCGCSSPGGQRARRLSTISLTTCPARTGVGVQLAVLRPRCSPASPRSPGASACWRRGRCARAPSTRRPSAGRSVAPAEDSPAVLDDLQPSVEHGQRAAEVVGHHAGEVAQLPQPGPLGGDVVEQDHRRARRRRRRAAGRRRRGSGCRRRGRPGSPGRGRSPSGRVEEPLAHRVLVDGMPSACVSLERLRPRLRAAARDRATQQLPCGAVVHRDAASSTMTTPSVIESKTVSSTERCASDSAPLRSSSAISAPRCSRIRASSNMKAVLAITSRSTIEAAGQQPDVPELVLREVGHRGREQCHGDREVRRAADGEGEPTPHARDDQQPGQRQRGVEVGAVHAHDRGPISPTRLSHELGGRTVDGGRRTSP